ncbi:MAG TPA: M20/M25/M40 family metallo-hydrolase [Solirubrobacteraceae bacterium]|jgi:putative aminopeptidase FrvX|nr:M20/M25/M40 family metallo-hydrolase [Solirubrobacteraceae bacterium]
MATPELLHRLLTAAGPSGRETAPAKVWRDGCAAFSDDVRADAVGSSMARVPGTADGPTLAVIGHIDEIGIHVTHIEDDGHLRFGEVGGWDPIVLVGQRVSIASRGGDVTGVIGRKPIHLIKSDERDRAPKVKDLHVDIGAKDGDEAKEMVRIGDAGVIDVAPVELPNGRLVSRALDNRVGCYVAAEAARLVAADGGAPGDVLALAVTQEETSFAGSRTSAFALEPDVAIVVDVIFATDQPGIELGPTTKHPLGSGPVIARGTALHPRVTDLLIDIAEEEEFPFTLESLGRATGTDADAVHASRIGVPTAIVSVPLRYMHSPVELVSLADVQVAAELIAAFAKRLEPGMSFAR